MQLNRRNSHSFKVILVGESGAGKSSLLERLCHNIFTGDIRSTIGIDLAIKRIFVDQGRPGLPYEGRQVLIKLWDSSGQERYRAITESYYRGSHAIVLVYDGTDIRSPERVNWWLKEIKDKVSQARVFILCNKIDKMKEGNGEWEEKGIVKIPGSIPVSAKTGMNVEMVFKKIAQELVDITRSGELYDVPLHDRKKKVKKKEKDVTPVKSRCC